MLPELIFTVIGGGYSVPSAADEKLIADEGE